MDNSHFIALPNFQENQSVSLEFLHRALEQLSAKNSVDLCAVSAQGICQACPFRKNKPNCSQCNRFL